MAPASALCWPCQGYYALTAPICGVAPGVEQQGNMVVLSVAGDLKSDFHLGIKGLNTQALVVVTGFEPHLVVARGQRGLSRRKTCTR